MNVKKEECYEIKKIMLLSFYLIIYKKTKYHEIPIVEKYKFKDDMKKFNTW